MCNDTLHFTDSLYLQVLIKVSVSPDNILPYCALFAPADPTLCRRYVIKPC